MRVTLGWLPVSIVLTVLASCGRPAGPDAPDWRLGTSAGTAPQTATGVASSSPAQPLPEPTVELSSPQASFTKNGSLTLEVAVFSPVATTATISLASPPWLPLERSKLEVALAAGERKVVTVTGQPKRRGYGTVTVSASAPGWPEPSYASMVGFDVGAGGADTGGKKSLEDHLKTLKVYEDSSWHAEVVKAELEGRDDVPLEVRLEGVKAKKLDGSDAAPFSGLVSFLPGSGSGRPGPGESGVAPATGSETRVRTLSCEPFSTSVHVSMIPPPGSYPTQSYALKDVKVTVLDRNTAYPLGAPPFEYDTVIASGFTNQAGVLAFQQPRCDTGGALNPGGPDIWFKVEAIDRYDVKILGSHANNTPFLHTVATGISWDSSQPATHFLPLSASSSSATQALRLLSLLQLGAEYNAVGGNGSTRFPLKVGWPALGTFAPVGSMNVGGGDWQHPFPAMHEFGHEVMWYTAMPSNYYSGYNSIIPLSPGYLPHFNYNHSPCC